MARNEKTACDYTGVLRFNVHIPGKTTSSTTTKKTMMFVFLVWILLFKIILFSLHPVTCEFPNFALLNSWKIFPCANVPHFYYLFISWWKSLPFLISGHHEEKSIKHRRSSISVVRCTFFWVYAPKIVYFYLKVDQFQAFIGTASLITTVAVQFCTLTNKKQMVFFPQILASMICHLP